MVSDCHCNPTINLSACIPVFHGISHHLYCVLILFSLVPKIELLYQRIVHGIDCRSDLLYRILRLESYHVQLEMRFQVLVLWSGELIRAL